MAENEKRCQVRMQWSKAYCGRELYDEEHCIFHSKKADKDFSLFQKKLNEIFRDKSLECYDFFDFIFPDGISFPNIIDKSISFEGSTFQGNVKFAQVVFQGTTYFLHTIFKGDVDFKLANFEGETYFEICTFKGDVDFWMAIFKNSAYLMYSTFYHPVCLKGVLFNIKADFSSSTFEDTLQIDEESKEKDKLFSKEEVDFRDTKFSRPEKVSFRKVDLSKFRFLGTDLRKVEFVDVDWYREKGRGRNKIYDEVSPTSGTKEFDYALIAQVYKRLRANYEENLNYAEAGDFHIGEMEMRRKGEKNILNKGVIWAYKLISNYGESYWLPLGWIALLILIFPFLYMLVGITPSHNIDINQNFETLRNYGSSLTYSLSVFSLVRERPYHTINNLGHILTILESIFSPVLIAFFLLALRRRFKR